MKIDFVGNENNYFENNEYIIFYANGPDKVSRFYKNIIYLNNVYSDTAFYLLTFNQKEGKRIESKASRTILMLSIFLQKHLFMKAILIIFFNQRLGR